MGLELLAWIVSSKHATSVVSELWVAPSVLNVGVWSQVEGLGPPCEGLGPSRWVQTKLLRPS